MKVTDVEGISEYRLDNGVRVLLFPDPSRPTVTVNMTVFVGSRHEGYGEAGMAHLLEHMLFKGTPTFDNIPKELQDRGADFNGTTWLDRTNYYETLPASEENLEFAIRLEADRLVNSRIRGEDLESEMTVVRNEFERGENSPIRILMQRMQAVAYEWHNYGKSTIGNRSDIERVPVVALRQFYRKYYRPDNVMVIVAGQFDPENALELLQEHFGALPAPEVPIDKTYTIEPPQDGERTVALRRVGDIQLVGAAYHVPPGSHEDYAAVKALTYVLGDEPSGRLYKALVEEKDLASEVYAFSYALHDPGLLMTLVEAPEDKSIEAVRQTLLYVLEQELREKPITEEEVERARQQILKERELQQNDTSQLAVALSDWAAQGDWRLYFLYRDRVEQLTADQVQAVAAKYLQRNNRTVGLFLPSDEAERVTVPEAPDLNKLLADYKGREDVQSGESFDVDPRAIEARTERGRLEGTGVDYALLPKKTRGGGVSLALTLRYGDYESLKGKAVEMSLLTDLMPRGTEDLTYQQLQDALAKNRANLSVGGAPGLVQVQLETKREFLDEVLDLLIDVVRRPRLDAAELEVVRRQSITTLESQLNEPQALSPTFVQRQLAPYPPEDPRYVPTLKESIERYRKASLDTIRDIHKRLLSAQEGELAVVGDFDPQRVKEKLQARLEGWSSEVEYERIPRPAHPDVPGTVERIETPDKANAFYYAAQQLDVGDTAEQYPAALMGNFILGSGALSSRLGDRVRQQEGLSYGIRSGLAASGKDEKTELYVYAIANPENVDRLMTVIQEEYDKLLEEGVTKDELLKAKEGYLQNQAVSRTKDSYLANKLIETMFTDRTMEWYAELEDKIRNVTVEQVNEALQKYLQPDEFVTAVAGDFAKVSEPAESK